MRSSAAPAVVRLPALPDLMAALRTDAAGAALLEGWSDAGNWRIALPWPEETRELTWDAACDWKHILAELEDEIEGEQGTFLPFAGGWVGFISYEAGACEEDVVPRAEHPAEPPFFFARHRAGVAVAPDGTPWLFAPAGSEDRYLRLLGTPGVPLRITPRPESVHDSLGGGLHQEMVGRIRAAIRDGDVYQVNLTRAFSCAVRCDPADLYRALTGARAPRSSALLHGNGWSIVSASPEVFLQFDRAQGVAESKPIKGTVRRRGDDPAEIATLLASAKDAAEHLMIVDVVRNDLGKIAPPGRVTVPEYRAVRTLESVHHLESTVRAEGLREVRVADLVAALSPAASITGAPKRAAVRMIRDLEPFARGVYCGAIGVLSARGVTLSVAIRTAVVTEDAVRYHAGGGVVWDSDAAEEDDECRAKAAEFLRYVGGSES